MINKIAMKRTALVLAFSGLAAGAVLAASLKTPAQKSGYAIGAQMGMQMKRQGVYVDSDSLSLGLKDSLTGVPLKMSDKQMQKALTDLRNRAMAKHKKTQAIVGAKNAKDAANFLAKNAKRRGVVTLKSGLQYRVLKKGKGAMPKASDTVTVNYQGTLPNGKVFDSSYKRGKPATFPLNGVIPGWTEGLQKMKTGATWMLYVPPKLAYGANGMPMGGIGPNQVLIFKVNLISIKSKK